ncbi:apolipoprotein N-acyltransferase [Sphingomonas sp. G-3-2-10]|uniref:apolipoprotein N-acyltransferase n=1 Tax=Sphingomonas sp. G-3-2-10 TaxID=2728838 RepID=UPI001469AAD2|nr:apolipoprotein N-acyltransferase [Sphingomonas sp. G-3-2-10]NML06637.1 apolipoprotein N-acyltransferase [Sphingomonas sp. G-3-2-10]
MQSRPLLAALLAGLISATGFAPLDWWPLLLAGLAVLLHLVHSAPTLKSALLRGWLFGLGHFTVGSNWIQHAFDYQDQMPAFLGYFAVVLLACYLAIYPAVAMGLAWRFAHEFKSRAVSRGADASYILAAAAAWIVTEWLRSVMFTGYPWNPLGVAWLPTPVAQSGAWLGTYALSGVMILASGAILLAFRRDWRGAGAFAATLALLSLAAIGSGGSQPEAGARHVRVVQPNIGQDALHWPDYNERVLAKQIEWSGRAGSIPRLIVWPEGMVNDLVEDDYPDPRFYRVDPRLIRARIAASLGPKDMILIGGNALFFDDNGKLAGAGNSIWAVDPDGMLGERYDKAHLVPFGEYLPLRFLLQPLGLSRFVMGDIDFIPGPGPRTIAVPGFGKVGMQICYEIIFSGHTVDRANRPDFLFAPSNDAWFGSWGPPQHLAQARMRAIEEGLPILRSTPTGISAIIDARGGLAGTVPHNQEGAAETPLPAPLPPTLFSRAGNWIAFLAAGLLLLFAIAIRRVSR